MEIHKKALKKLRFDGTALPLSSATKIEIGYESVPCSIN
jgi:hypothetical protein